MKELYEQIKRFQSFSERTGRSKSSSYHVSINFSAHFDDDDSVYVEVGGYDVGGWNRHHSMETTGENLLKDFTALVDEADRITKYDRYCPSCQEYTDHDPKTGKCYGFNDWGEAHECNEVIDV